MARNPQLTPDNQFPGDALGASVQKPPSNISVPTSMLFTWQIATAADAISPWGRNPQLRDRQLRDFWPTESFLAGSIANVSFRNAAYDWEIRGSSTKVEQLVTDMLKASIAGDAFGWKNFVLKFSQDLYTQDNGAFIELIRDPGVDGNSKFKDEKAPVLGIAHIDSNRCTRTGDPKFPIVYEDRSAKMHKLAWYQVIPFSDYPSAIETMNGIGYCGTTRVLRLGQIMRSIFIFKDEKVSGRHYKTLHMVSGVSRQDLKDILKLGQEDADNAGQIRYIDPAILASLDPEKPVSTASIDLAGLPDNFDYDQEMRWYITGLALCFGVDYQEFAPLSSGAIGSGNQSQILNQKAAGKGPAMFMKISEAFANYGVLPRDYEMIFEDRDEQRSMDKQQLRKAFQEEMALGLRNGYFDPETARKIGVKRGIYSESELSTVPEGYGEDLLMPKQPIGDTGGNTIADDAARTNVGTPNNTIGGRLRKAFNFLQRETENEVSTRSENIFKSFAKALGDAKFIVNVPKQEPPVVNVTIPEQKPPTINVKPSSVVVKENKIRKQTQSIKRDNQGNMTSTETQYEYEGEK